MTREIHSARELTDLAELQDIRFWEIVARRVDAEDAKDSQTLEAFIRQDDSELGIRCRSSVQGQGGHYVADVEAVFSLPADQNLAISEEAMQEFVERVGLMVVYPYIRATIWDSAGKLSLKRPLMKLMKSGGRLQRQPATSTAERSD